MEKLLYTVYQITNKLNGKIYVGVHQTVDLNDGYYRPGVLIQKAIKKYGIENIEKEILYIFDSAEEMFSKEAELVNEEFVSRSDTYNLNVGGECGWDCVNFSGNVSRDPRPGYLASPNMVNVERSIANGNLTVAMGVGIHSPDFVQETSFLGRSPTDEAKKKKDW